VAQDARTAQTGAYLRMLLARPGIPRSIWEKHAGATGSGEIDTDAVCEVLRRHGADEPDLAATVRAALDGTDVRPQTLESLIAAFDLGPRNATRLRDLLSGSDSVRVITTGSLAALYRAGDAPRLETLALHEMHTLGPDGLPAEHQTIQVIKSTVDGLAAYPYRFDTDELVVEVVRGGRVGDTYRVTDNFFGVDILLDRPLALDETTLVHFRTTFLYRTPPPLEFRRGVRGTMRDVTLWLRFDPQKLPSRVFLGRWARLDDPTLVDAQNLELDGEFSVHARFETVTEAIVGFGWEWDDDES
jgi:hypothetical protein